ncbi:golvesin C-terminal-like domain-containing protein [Paenibacillus roseipurpureus]|uniref:mannan endo-1,4-beta-mannosidase n=1 Tax=Paenibacillus roseopurpureus TaxID=2918901 RepID=A0AA96LTD3_9BACL|nr:cellulase family glycosylhydrolase [Paenibacillus sp. MBLB1832]WNR45628.1 cellulase family glycosylhydrolase [Paenibacillus sp. MBLB1832]
MARRIRYRLVILALGVMVALTAITFQPQPAQAGFSSFVTRTGNQLKLDGTTYRFSGANLYWLGLYKVKGDTAATYPTKFRVIDALQTAKEMGASVVRAHTLGVSVGCSLCIMPSLGTYNEEAFKKVDFAIKAAGDAGIRLIIPLTDNYTYYHGGKKTFTDWRGKAESTFYTDATVINDFKGYISALLNRVNSYTGVAYKNDPTILAWETGNELSSPVSWTQTVADYIKSVDANHLVMDGHYGVDTNALSLSSVDIYSSHFNGTLMMMTASAISSQAALAVSGNKVFVAGEYDWSNSKGTGDLTGFISQIETNTNVGGDMYWSMFGHGDQSGFLKNDDGYSLNYPGETTDLRTRSQQLRNHSYFMKVVSTPAAGTTGAALLTSITKDASGVSLQWRGTAGADNYSVERATAGATGPWTVVCNQCVTDYSGSYLDTSSTGAVWYRIRSYNRDGVAGAYSEVAAFDGSHEVQVVDEQSADTTGKWPISSYATGAFQGQYLIASTGTGASTVKWKVGVKQPGNYNVYYWLPDGYTDRASNASFKIYDTAGVQNVTVNEQLTGGQWKYLGKGNFTTSAPGYIELSDSGNNAYVTAGAIKLVNADTAITLDNTNATITGSWSASTNMPNYYGSNYLIKTVGTGAAAVRWTPTITEAGTYQIYYWLPDGYTDRITNASYTVYDGNSVNTGYTVNEQSAGGSWILLGSHPFNIGTSGYIEMKDTGNNTYVVADAIRLVKQ